MSVTTPDVDAALTSLSYHETSLTKSFDRAIPALASKTDESLFE